MGWKSHRSIWAALAAIVCTLGLGSPSPAQTKLSGFNEREIEPTLHAFDKADTWTLYFRFKDPRIVTIDVPGRGKKIVWYMWYQVYNLSKEPRYFLPDFELKTQDYETVHTDEIMPTVQVAIAKIENPNGFRILEDITEKLKNPKLDPTEKQKLQQMRDRLEVKNSVEINKEPIPVTPENSFPRLVTGVAIWTDIYDRAPKTNRFSIFVSGLSDGWRKDPKDNIIRRQTLHLNFQRLGDEIQNDPNSIRWIDNPIWIYRATGDNQGPPPEKKEPAILEQIPAEPVSTPRLPGPPALRPMPPLLDRPMRMP